MQRQVDINKLNKTLGDAVMLGVISIERAAKFMSFGVNASSNKDIGFHLDGLMQFGLGPDELTEEMCERLRGDFSQWIVGNGLREMLGGMEVSLARIYAHIKQAVDLKSRKNEASTIKKIKDFEKLGVSGRLKKLEKEFQFDIPAAEHFKSITQARNCLTHRMGFVGEEDCEEGEEEFRLTWLGFDSRIIRRSGEEVPITLERTEGIKYEAGSKISTHIPLKCIPFAKGSQLVISPRKLEEIALMSSHAIYTVHALAINNLIDNGYLVNNGEKALPPTVSMFISGPVLTEK